MKLSKLAVAMAAILGAGVSSGVYAIDLYVDTKTEQIYAKPGPGRVHMGSFVRQDAQAKVPDRTAGSTADKPMDTAADKTDAAELTAVRRDIELKAKMMGARLTSDLASLEERVKETEKVHIEFHEGAPHFASK